MGKLDVGLLYLSLHNQLIRRVGRERIMKKKEFFTIVGTHFLIPKNLRTIIIIEMEERKMIQQINNNEIKVLGYDLNIEEDVNKFYKHFKLF